MPNSAQGSSDNSQSQFQLIISFIEHFESELLAEYHYLKRVDRSDHPTREEVSRVKCYLKILINLATLVPLAGDLLGKIVTSVSSVIEEGNKLIEKIQNPLEQLTKLHDALSEIKDENDKLSSLKAFSDSHMLIDEQQLRLLAKKIAPYVARRYEYAVVNLIQEENVVVVAREGARRLWDALLSKEPHGSDSKPEPSTKLSIQQPSLALLNSILLGNDGKRDDTLIQKIKLRWKRFDKAKEIILRTEVDKPDVYIADLYYRPAFFDNQKMYTHAYVQENKGIPLHGYAFVSDKSEIAVEIKDTFNQTQLLRNWAKKTIFRDITQQDIEGYLQTGEMVDARDSNKTSSLSLREFIIGTESDIYLTCVLDLSQYLLAFGDYSNIDWSRATISNDISGAVFRDAAMIGCRFIQAKSEKAVIDFTGSDLRSSHFQQCVLKQVNFQQSDLSFSDFYTSTIALDEVLGTLFYKAHIGDIQPYNQQANEIKKLQDKAAEQAESFIKLEKNNEEHFVILESEISNLWKQVNMQNQQQIMLAQAQEDNKRLQMTYQEQLDLLKVRAHLQDIKNQETDNYLHQLSDEIERLKQEEQNYKKAMDEKVEEVTQQLKDIKGKIETLVPQSNWEITGVENATGSKKIHVDVSAVTTPDYDVPTGMSEEDRRLFTESRNQFTDLGDKNFQRVMQKPPKITGVRETGGANVTGSVTALKQGRFKMFMPKRNQQSATLFTLYKPLSSQDSKSTAQTLLSTQETVPADSTQQESSVVSIRGGAPSFPMVGGRK